MLPLFESLRKYPIFILRYPKPTNMRTCIFTSVLFLCTLTSLAQSNLPTTTAKRNSLYAEVFGQGLYNSFAFDRLQKHDGNLKTSFSCGLTLIPTPELFVLGTPLSYNLILGQRNHHLELGIGVTPMYIRLGNIDASETITDANGFTRTNNFRGHRHDFYSFFTPKIGYRFQKNSGGLFLRVTATPPVAGINSLGGLRGGKLIDEKRQTEYFSSAAFFGYRMFPWGGLSIGWTLRR